MNDAQALIDGLRAALEIPESVSPDQFAELAREYAAICTQINTRLESCSKFLRAGNHSEAIRLAELTPELLNICNIVDFPDRDDWNQMCRSLNISVAPAITNSIIEQLHDAYNVNYPLDALLREHRRLALSRAPLSGRLTVLYKMHEAESENIIWTDMIAKYEIALFDEMKRDFYAAKSGKLSGQVILDMKRQIDANLWHHSPPKELVQEILDWTKKAVIRQSEQQFRSILDNFQKSLVDGDIARAKHWEEQWKSKLKAIKLSSTSLSEELRSGHALATSKLATMEKQIQLEGRMHRRTGELQQLLTESDDPDELSIKLEEVTQFAHESNLEIPQYLVDSARQKIAKLRSNAKQRLLIIVSSVALIALILFLCVFLIVRGYSRNAGFNQALSKGQVALSQWKNGDETTDYAGLLTEARQARDQIRNEMPHQIKKFSFTRFESELDSAIKEQEGISAQFEKNFLTLKKRFEEKPAEPITEDEFQQAKKQARLPEERERITSLQNDYNQFTAGEKKLLKNRLDTQKQDFQERLNNLEESDSIPLDEATSQLSAIRKEIEAFEPQGETTLWGTYREGLFKQVGELEKGLGDRQLILSRIDALVQQVGSQRNFSEAIKNLRIDFPESSFAKDSKNLDDLMGQFFAVAKWNSFATENADQWSKLGNEIKGWDSFTTALTNLQGNAATEELDSIRETLRFFEPLRTKGGRQKINESLEKFLSQFETPSLFVFRGESDGKPRYIYSVAGRIYRRDGSTGPLPLSEEEQSQLRSAAHGSSAVTSLAKIRPMLNSTNWTSQNWYETIYAILSEFQSRTSNNIDPLLCFVILRKCCDILSDDPLWEKYFSPWKTILLQATVPPDPDWSDYESKPNESFRVVAEKALNELPPIDSLFDSLREENTKRQQPLTTQYHWVGFLVKKGGQWDCRLIQSGQQPGDRFVCRKVSDDKIQLVQASQRDQEGNTRWLRNDLFQSQPVFLRSVQPEK